jgi:hypothetical protein
MAVGFPAKTTFANGNVLPASDLNDIAGTLNSLVNGAYTGNVTTNASTATALKTARTINTVSFDGTANIKTHTGGQDITTSGAIKYIPHGLGTTPSSVVVSARADTYNTTPKILTVGNIGATNFTVFANNADGSAASTPFSWIAVA